MDNGATLGGLKLAIQAKLGVPLDDMLLSKNPALVRGQLKQGQGNAHRGCCWADRLPLSAGADWNQYLGMLALHSVLPNTGRSAACTSRSTCSTLWATGAALEHFSTCSLAQRFLPKDFDYILCAIDGVPRC